MIFSSIYEGDPAFTADVVAKKFQYKYGEDGVSKSFILELFWSSEYPECVADVSLDTFYNKHLKAEVKEEILEAVKQEAEQYLGMSMTYTLFEYVKENLDKLLEKQPEAVDIPKDELSEAVESNLTIREEKGKSPVKKEQLTKAQKRRMWDKGGIAGEDRPRGWDWVDVIKHLSQTGAKE